MAQRVQIAFPEPRRLSPGCARWTAAEITAYEAAIGITADRPARPYLTDREVAARYGVSRATVWRWSGRVPGTRAS